MPEYYLTVGERYRSEEHPHDLHPDGYAVIEAETYEDARKKAFYHIGTKWAFIYGTDELDMKMFPKGELLRIK